MVTPTLILRHVLPLGSLSWFCSPLSLCRNASDSGFKVFFHGSFILRVGCWKWGPAFSVIHDALPSRFCEVRFIRYGKLMNFFKKSSNYSITLATIQSYNKLKNQFLLSIYNAILLFSKWQAAVFSPGFFSVQHISINIFSSLLFLVGISSSSASARVSSTIVGSSSSIS